MPVYSFSWYRINAEVLESLPLKWEEVNLIAAAAMPPRSFDEAEPIKWPSTRAIKVEGGHRDLGGSHRILD